jgi:hypothetical protein
MISFVVIYYSNTCMAVQKKTGIDENITQKHVKVKLWGVM